MIVILLVERLFEASLCFIPNNANRSQLISSCIVTALWSTALMVGVMRRMNWCRYILIFYEFIQAAATMVFFIMALKFDITPAQRMNLNIGAGAMIALHGGVAWLLIRSRDIKRLTSRAQD